MIPSPSPFAASVTTPCHQVSAGLPSYFVVSECTGGLAFGKLVPPEELTFGVQDHRPVRADRFEFEEFRADGWMIGEGSGSRKMSPDSPRRLGDVTFGGVFGGELEVAVLRVFRRPG